MRRLLCISGKRFSGKDTLAALLQNEAQRRRVDLELYAFAGESKRLFAHQEKARGVDVDLDRLLTDRAYKEALRPQLTRFTVDAIAADPLVFCREVARRIETSSAAAVVTDLRLRLEVEHLRTRFALHVVRLRRSDEHRAAAGWRADPAVDAHHTETELDDPSWWSEVIDNDGTIPELAARAAALIQRQLSAAS
jgi:phosphomevalonate kinase